MSNVISISEAKIYQRDSLILKDVNFNLDQKEFVYLIGKTGSGKSSFLKTLYGELGLTVGQGSVAGFDLTKLKSKQIPLLRRKIGIVFQDFQLLMDRSVMKNLVSIFKTTILNRSRFISSRRMSVLSKKLPLFFKLGYNLCCKRVNNLFTFFLLVKEKEELRVDILTIF